MGFLKKIFKPVAKVFDKIIPNEIKPALPYLAAFAPMLAPTTGFMGSMMGRALLSGGANIGAQLAQEGNEGDINALSALLAGGVGALSAPGAGDTLRGGTMANDPSMLTREGIMSQMSSAPMGANSLNQAQPFLGRTTDSALNFLGQGADKLSGINAAGVADPFSMAGLKAAAIPFAQGTGDLMYAEGDRAMKDYEKALLDYENGLAEGQLATNAGRRAAIISAMTAGQHSQQVIDDTLAELGLRNGGIISLQNGGRVNFRGGGMDAAEPDFGGIPKAIKNIKTSKIEDVSEIVELNDLSKLDGFAEMLATIDKEDPQYNSVRKMAISEAEMVGEKYQISPVDLVGYMDTKTDMFSEKTIDDGKKEVLMENIKNTSFGFSEGGIMNGYNMGGRVNFKEGGSDIFGMGGEEVIPKMGEKIGEGASSFSNLITDDEGNVYTLLQYLRKFGEDAFFGGQKNPELPENFYNKLGDNYIQEMNEVKERGYNMGGSVLPQGMEMDYRGGGFIPMGSAERADDVDARVSKNEFVMTADAVRAAGGGSVNQGAKRMYELMNNLEARA